MALTKVTGQVVNSTTDLTVGVLTATTVSIAGTLTYEDVTNVDSVGLITARSGIQGSGTTLSADGNGFFTGIVTTTSLSINGINIGRGLGDVATNTAVGAFALDANTTGSNNTAIGEESLTSCTEGFRNTAVGSNTLSTLTTGDNNIAVGSDALNATTTADNDNVAVGYNALTANTTGSNNTAVGKMREDLQQLHLITQFLWCRYWGNPTPLARKTAFGQEALEANTTTTIMLRWDLGH